MSYRRLAMRPPDQPLGGGTIVLRMPRERDVDALVRYGDDPDVAETIWVPIPTPCSSEQARERIREFTCGWQKETRFGPALIIADAQNEEMLGIVFLGSRNQAVELSYGVAAKHRNRGIATTALTVVSNWCVDELGASRVEVKIATNNLASQRVAAKAVQVRQHRAKPRPRHPQKL
jgi:RimJ/RimL family protein N-acetyltransferase